MSGQLRIVFIKNELIGAVAHFNSLQVTSPIAVQRRSIKTNKKQLTLAAALFSRAQIPKILARIFMID
jgi:hypothetical protein